MREAIKLLRNKTKILFRFRKIVISNLLYLLEKCWRGKNESKTKTFLRRKEDVERDRPI